MPTTTSAMRKVVLTAVGLKFGFFGAAAFTPAVAWLAGTSSSDPESSWFYGARTARPDILLLTSAEPNKVLWTVLGLPGPMTAIPAALPVEGVLAAA